MNPAALPNVGIINNYDKDFYGTHWDLSNKNVLCIGFSQQELSELVQKYGVASITVLTKWEEHVDAQIEGHEFVVGDITERTMFEDGRFDAVLTLSVLEHLDPLPDAFAEMRRIVKPGGALIHLFGPVYSCAYGHHLYVRHGDPLLEFTQWAMPAHMHLLCSSPEIADFYRQAGYGGEETAKVVDWIENKRTINGVFFDDYMKIFCGPEYRIEYALRMSNQLPDSHVATLRERYPDVTDFDTYGMKIVLRLS